MLMGRDYQEQIFSGLLKIKEASLLLGVSPSTLRNWDRLGKLKPIRHPMNKYRLYRMKDIQNILKKLEKQ
jgi:DNA-binding transcriptional MerR regulator